MTIHLERVYKRQIGRILLDGHFIRKQELDRAAEEQKLSKELLGQILVRLGVLDPDDIKVPLLLQPHLGTIGDAARMAAGERRLLGKLLVDSGKITKRQLDAAIAEQKRSGEKLGAVFIRLGLLTQGQLQGLLEFQFNQGVPGIDSPLRLGELLVTTGQISREQLDTALDMQRVSKKKIGAVLVEQGYLTRRKLRKAFRVQSMLVRAVLSAILALGAGGAALASTVSLKWNPVTDPAAVGYRVYHGDAGSPLSAAPPIDVKTATTATIDSLDPAVSYQFAVTTYDAYGSESEMSNVVVLAEQVPPVVELNSPPTGTSVTGVVNVTASATDNVGVTKVEIWVNNVLATTATEVPCTYSWDTSVLPQGSYTVVAKAFDAAGNVGQASSTVNVVNDTVPPVVDLVSPANGATLSGTVTISIGASDNVGVSSVQILANGLPIYNSNVAPYSFSWDTTKVGNGSYAISAVARDNAGNEGYSAVATVTVSNQVPDLVPPVLVAFTLPATSTSLTVPVLQVTASDAVGVTGYLVSEDSTPPAAGDARWMAAAPSSITFASPGSKTAHAWAKDAAGNVSATLGAAVVITLPDTVAPVVTSFTIPSSSKSLTVPVTGFSATDAVGVTGYLITESPTSPKATDAGWTGAPPTSFTFSSAGTKTAYAWAKDAAGNVSAGASKTVKIRR